MPRHPQVMIAEAQEIYYLQNCLIIETHKGERKLDHHTITAFFILEQMHCDLMREAKAIIDAESANQSAES